MQFKFDANQECQVKAVETAVNLLEGRQRISGAAVEPALMPGGRNPF